MAENMDKKQVEEEGKVISLDELCDKYFERSESIGEAGKLVAAEYDKMEKAYLKQNPGISYRKVNDFLNIAHFVKYGERIVKNVQYVFMKMIDWTESLGYKNEQAGEFTKITKSDELSVDKIHLVKLRDDNLPVVKEIFGEVVAEANEKQKQYDARCEQVTKDTLYGDLILASGMDREWQRIRDQHEFERVHGRDKGEDHDINSARLLETKINFCIANGLTTKDETTDGIQKRIAAYCRKHGLLLGIAAKKSPMERVGVVEVKQDGNELI